MKNYLSTIVVGIFMSVASFAGAQAACNTAALAGAWMVVATDGEDCVLTINTLGNVSGSCGSGRLTLSSTCKLGGRLAIATVEGRTEVVAPSSPVKPNIMLGRLLIASTTQGFIAYRR
jgi:hypothetical protein